jgi:hypothetical protein
VSADPLACQVVDLTFAPGNPTIAYAVVHEVSDPRDIYYNSPWARIALYRSDDGGATWAVRHSCSCTPAIFDDHGGSWYLDLDDRDAGLWIDPADSNHVAYWSGGLVRHSLDGGTSASAVPNPGATWGRMLAFGLTSAGGVSHLLLGTQRGLASVPAAAPGSEWALRSNGLEAGGTWSCVTAAADGTLAVGGRGLLIRGPGSSAWETVAASATDCKFAPAGGALYFIDGLKDLKRRDGESITTVRDLVDAFDVSESGGVRFIVAVRMGRLERAFDAGPGPPSWECLLNCGSSSVGVRHVAVSPVHPDRVLAWVGVHTSSLFAGLHYNSAATAPLAQAAAAWQTLASITAETSSANRVAFATTPDGEESAYLFGGSGTFGWRLGGATPVRFTVETYGGGRDIAFGTPAAARVAYLARVDGIVASDAGDQGPWSFPRSDFRATTLGMRLLGGRLYARTAGRGIWVATPGQTATAPHPPRDLIVSAVAGQLVTVTWRAPASGPTPTDYVLEGGLSPGQVLASMATGSATTSFTFTAPSGSFLIRIHSRAGAERSAASNEVALHVGVPVAPSAPTGLLGLGDGASLALSWRNTYGGGAPAGVVLTYSGPFSGSLRLGATETFRFDGVPPGTYTFRVQAENGRGLSAPSMPVTLSFPGPCSGIPQAPARLIVTRAGREVTAAWEPPPAGPAATAYLLSVRGAYAGVFPVEGRLISGSVGPGSYTLTVAAANRCGVGPASEPVTVSVP